MLGKPHIFTTNLYLKYSIIILLINVSTLTEMLSNHWNASQIFISYMILIHISLKQFECYTFVI